MSENSELTPRDLALMHPGSETIVALSGKLDKVFDINNLNNCASFVDIIKSFRIPNSLKKQAKKLGEVSKIVKTPQELLDMLLIPFWRQWPALFDVPAPSQIFGHLVYSAGIEGILYRSKFTDQLCLVIFPEKFVGTDSYICLADEPPHSSVLTRIDGYNCCDNNTNSSL